MAQAAIGWLVLTYGWNLPAPQNLDNPVSVVVVTVFSLLALVTFAGPLLGLHRLLEAEKGRLLGEAGSRMEAALGELHRRVDADEMGATWRA